MADGAPFAQVLGGAVSLLAAALLLAVALVVLRAAPRKPTNQLFGLFLVLIAGNAVTDGLIKFTVDAAQSDLLRRLGFAFLALDPGVLLYFTLVFPRRSRAADHPLTLPLLGGVWVGLAALVVVAPAQFADVVPRPPGQLAVVAYLAVCYAAAYLVLLRRFAAEASPTVLRQLTSLAGALGITVLLRLGLLSVDLYVLPVAPHLVAVPLAFAAFGAAVLWSLRGAAEPGRAALLGAHRLTAVGLVVLSLVALVPFALEPLVPPAVADALARFSGASVFFGRWVAFTAIVAHAILRYQVLDIAVRLRRAVEGAGAAAAVAALFLVLWVAASAAQPLLAQLGPAQGAALVGAALGAVPVARYMRRWAAARWPAEEGAREAALRRVEVYRASVEAALGADGNLARDAQQELQRQREALGLTEEQHEVVLELARADRLRAGSANPGSVRPTRIGGRYELGAELGRGGSGIVFLARDALLNREVVVKALNAGPEERPARRALAEARAAGGLNHPNIVTVFDVVEGPGVSYLVMEYLPGGNLRDLLASGPLDPGRAAPLLDALLRGLEAAHERGLVHGDVKPENVLLDAEDRPKLADFGSARRAGPASATLASLPSREGRATVPYMAPEQVEGEAATTRSDLYAAAAVAYEVLTGEHYLDLRGKGDFAVREAILRQPPRLPRADLAPALQVWLERGLAKDPRHRWPSAAAMREGLAAAAAGPTASGKERRRLPSRMR